MADKPSGAELGDLLGKFLSRAQHEASRAARYGRDMLALRQLRSDRDQMFVKLGKEVRQLVDAGEVTHPGLVRGVGRIAEFEERIRASEEALRRAGVDPDADPAAATPPEESGR